MPPFFLSALIANNIAHHGVHQHLRFLGGNKNHIARGGGLFERHVFFQFSNQLVHKASLSAKKDRSHPLCDARETGGTNKPE